MSTSTPASLPRLMALRYPGTCATCGRPLAVGSEAIYDPRTKEAFCLSCDGTRHDPTTDAGTPGGSARRELERRVERRETRIKDRFGKRLGGLIVALSDEPQTTEAWRVGALGEEKLANALAGVAGITVLHDRWIPGSKANIDYLVVGPAGIFVIDAKHYQGRIGIHDKGGLFRSDPRLFVGRRDCSALADDVLWQLGIVEAALRDAGETMLPPLVGVLCFIDGDWPLFRPPTSFRGVRLESERTIQKLVPGDPILDEPSIDRWARFVDDFAPQG